MLLYAGRYAARPDDAMDFVRSDNLSVVVSSTITHQEFPRRAFFLSDHSNKTTVLFHEYRLFSVAGTLETLSGFKRDIFLAIRDLLYAKAKDMFTDSLDREGNYEVRDRYTSLFKTSNLNDAIYFLMIRVTENKPYMMWLVGKDGDLTLSFYSNNGFMFIPQGTGTQVDRFAVQCNTLLYTI